MEWKGKGKGREREGKVRRSLWRGGEKKWKRLDGKNHAAAKNHKKQALLKGAKRVSTGGAFQRRHVWTGEIHVFPPRHVFRCWFTFAAVIAWRGRRAVRALAWSRRWTVREGRVRVVVVKNTRLGNGSPRDVRRPVVRPGAVRRGFIGRTCASSSGVHFSFLMDGLTLCRHRCAHCWPVFPGSSAATRAQRLPQISCFRVWAGLRGSARGK